MKNVGMLLILSAFALTSLEAAWGNGQKGGSAVQQTQSYAGSGSNQNILFIQTAREAVIERSLGEAKGSYTLTLKGVQPNLAFFGDQPQRLAGKVTVDQFVSDWNQGNGVMAAGGQSGSLSGALVTTSTTPSNVTDVSQSLLILSNPIYDARSQELKFNVRNVSGNQIEAGRHPNPILFIDNN